MNFTPQNCACRTLLIEANALAVLNPTTTDDFTNFSAFISIKEEPYNYCYIQLKNVLLDTLTPANATTKDIVSYYVKSQLGQQIYSNNHTNKDYLGSFVFKRDNANFNVIDQPLIELSTIPHGIYDFKIRGENDTAVDSDHIDIDGVTLVFQVYMCKR